MQRKTRHRGIVQLGREHYEIRARARCARTGRRKEVRRKFRGGLKAARAKQEQMREELEEMLRAAAPRLERVRLADFVRSWLRGRIENGELKPSSAEKIASVWDLHIAGTELADLYIDDIHPEDIEHWLAIQRTKRYIPGKGKAKTRKGKPRPYSTGAIKGNYRVLKSIIAAATARYLLPDPCKGVKAPRARTPRGNVLRRDELERVLAFIEKEWPDWYPAVLLDVFTGLRWGELSALRWEDIDDAEGVIHVRRSNWKGQAIEALKCDEVGEGKEKVIPLVGPVAEALREHRRRMVAGQHPGLEAGWIFPTRLGTLHKGAPLRKVLTQALAAAGVTRRVTPHGLRHTANDLLRRVASGEVVRSIIGHSTPQMTVHYSHVDEDEKRAAVQSVYLSVIAGGKAEKG